MSDLGGTSKFGGTDLGYHDISGHFGVISGQKVVKKGKKSHVKHRKGRWVNGDKF